ncbi:MAG TPA: hypothetical protein VFO40_06380, partial [Chthoniobacterales bacterium]|nr:hypothetical protein [Chthoniobacterales bacterium]
ATYVRNIQGHPVELTLVEVDPNDIKLDPTNPRIGFSMRQLEEAQRNEGACVLLLTSQEDTEALKRSIIASNGVQEPIYLRSDRRVAEGNRRVVALRAAQEEFPEDSRFLTMPAWLIPQSTPEHVIQDLLNEIHLGSVRGWAPYERALQMRGLLENGLIEDEIAERYRMTTREVRQHLAAVEFMDRMYFPITSDPTDPEHRTKFSYFLEFYKNGRIQEHSDSTPGLPERFAQWVRDGHIDTGARVRRLPKILDSEEATRLLDVVGFDAADEYLAKQNPGEQELYALIERTRARLSAITVAELVELGRSNERQAIIAMLQKELNGVMDAMERVG